MTYLVLARITDPGWNDRAEVWLTVYRGPDRALAEQIREREARRGRTALVVPLPSPTGDPT